MEEQLRGVREDVSELVAESQRNRRRLHDLEGVTGALVSADTQRKRDDRRKQERLEIRLQVLTAVVAVAAVVEPFLYHIATGK